MDEIQKRKRARRVALTIDDGPTTTATASILDILAKHRAPALLFIVGHRLASPEGRALVARAAGEGHLLGNHTFSHAHLAQLADDEIARELEEAQVLLEGLQRDQPRYFRAPYGDIDERVLTVATRLGYVHVPWTIDSLDYDSRFGPDGSWVEHSLTEIGKARYSVLLLHDCETTARNLERLLVGIEANRRHRFLRYC
jgi:peptidoglycan/xylan/chitin deacetylase (PgdA/CDA1 family)